MQRSRQGCGSAGASPSRQRLLPESQRHWAEAPGCDSHRRCALSSRLQRSLPAGCRHAACHYRPHRALNDPKTPRTNPANSPQILQPFPEPVRQCPVLRLPTHPHITGQRQSRHLRRFVVACSAHGFRTVCRVSHAALQKEHQFAHWIPRVRIPLLPPARAVPATH